MNGSTTGRFGRLAVLCACGWMASNSNAEIFYAGQTKGFAGEAVELSINARAGTVLEAIDIVPGIAAVEAALDFVSFGTTAGLTAGGSGLCTGQACAFFYVPEKSFAADTVLATLRFTIDAGAPTGPVAFDAGVTVGADPLPIPAGANFEVLAIPEPSTWALFGLGALLVAGVARRRAAGQA